MTLEDELAGIEDEVVIVTSPPERYRETLSRVIRSLSNDGSRPGIYLAANLPHRQIIERLEDDGIPTDDILFLDAVTERGRSDIADNAMVFDSPANLTSLSIAVTNVMDEMGPEKPFIVVDSLSALSMYNPDQKLTAFLHHLIGRSRDWGVAVAVVAIEEGEESAVMSRITQLCDRVITA